MSSDLPACIDAERRVLGSLIVFYSPNVLARVKETGLRPSDFYWRTHEAVYRTVLALDERDGFADVFTVSRFLAGQKHSTSGTWLVRIGGPAKLEELAAHADANGCLPCARIVAEDGRWRRWLGATYDALEAIDARDEDAFWAAVGRVREDARSGGLHAIDGGKEAA